MPKKPTPADADLLLKLYDLRREAEKIGTGHLLGANPLICRMDDSNSWRSVHQGDET